MTTKILQKQKLKILNGLVSKFTYKILNIKLFLIFCFIFLSSCWNKQDEKGDLHRAKNKRENLAHNFNSVPNSIAIRKSAEFKQYENSISICSWNLCDFGKSKNDSVIEYIARTVNDFDIIAIQEVVAGYGGSEAIIRLVDDLNDMGFKWDYSISDPTSSNNSYKIERYAFIWKDSKVRKMGNAWLEVKYNLEIDREPYFATFKPINSEIQFTLTTFHAITKAKNPETEIKYFKFFPAEYPELNLIFCGDFNCNESNSVFNPLKTQGYKPALENQKTSLRDRCLTDGCLASEYDNIFYNSSKIEILNSGVVHFYNDFNSNQEAKRISDHIPIYSQFSIK